MSQFNRLLMRQLQRLKEQGKEVTPEMEPLLIAVSQAYDHFEKNRLLLERAMDLSSEELMEANKKLKSQARELSVSNDELKQLAYVAAYDLSEPLKTIKGVVHLLADDETENLSRKGQSYLRKILLEVSKMKDLLEDLKDYSLINSEGDIHPTKIDLNHVMKNVSESLFLPISQNNGVIFYENLPMVLGDENQINQLFHNLIDNSIKFKTDRPPFIKVTSDEWSEKKYKVSVKDNGIGIRPEHQDKAFQLFKKLHDDNEFEGNGLGLAICKKIVTAHGGKIWINDKIEEGLEVSFTLPKE